MAASFRSEKRKAEKGNIELLCSNIALLDIPRVDRCQLKGKVNIIGFFKITSCFRFRRAHPDSHATVVAQLSVPSPPKSALAAAFACVEISPSVVINLRNKPLYSRGQKVKAGELPCRTFVLDLPVNRHGVFWEETKKSLELFGTASKAGMGMSAPCWALCHFPGQRVKVSSSSWRRMFFWQALLLNKKVFKIAPASLALCSYLHRRCGPCCLAALVWLHAAIISIMGSRHRQKLLLLLSALTPRVFDC